MRRGLLGVAIVLAGGGVARGDVVDEEPTIVVTGSRGERWLEDSPVTTEVITRRSIEASGAQSVAEVLSTHPGITVERSFRGAGISIHGLDGPYVLVLVDGRRVGGRVDGSIDLERIPVENVERIEIVKGPASALYGSDAIGGVVNIVTRRRSAPVEAEVRTGVTSVAGWDVMGSSAAQGEHLTTRLSASVRSEPSYDLSPDTLGTSGSAFDQAVLDHSTSWDVTGDLELTGTVSLQARNQAAVDAQATGAVFDRRIETREAAFTVQPVLRLGESLRLTPRASYSFFQSRLDLDQRGSTALDEEQLSREHTTEAGVQLDGTWGRHVVTVGTDLLDERFDSDRLGDGSAARTRVALYGQDEWTVGRIVIVPGARVDADTQFGLTPSPKLAVRWDPASWLVVRSSVGAGFRAPSFQELYLYFENPGAGYLVAGNEQLAPERSWSETLDLELTFRPGLTITAGLYRTDLSNLIYIDVVEQGSPGEPDRYGYVNVARAHTQGGELRVAARPWRWLDGSLAYAFTDAVDEETDLALAGQARHELSGEARVSFASTRTRASMRGKWIGRRPLYGDMNATTMLSPYVVADAHVEQELGDHFSLFVGGENLSGAGDAEDLPMRPRTFRAGLTARY